MGPPGQKVEYKQCCESIDNYAPIAKKQSTRGEWDYTVGHAEAAWCLQSAS